MPRLRRNTAAQRWWRTLADEVSPAQAQTGLDRFCVRVGDARPRRRVDGTATTVAGLAADEALRPMPTAPFPATLSADAQISAQALVAFRGNSYSVGPGMAGTTVTVVHRLGTATLEHLKILCELHRGIEDNPVLDVVCDCTCLFGQEACLTDPACDPRLHSRCIAGHANGSC